MNRAHNFADDLALTVCKSKEANLVRIRWCEEGRDPCAIRPPPIRRPRNVINAIGHYDKSPSRHAATEDLLFWFVWEFLRVKALHARIGHRVIERLAVGRFEGHKTPVVCSLYRVASLHGNAT